jgi:Xaa-Pro aminopeptidase
MGFDYAGRVRRLQALMTEEGVDVVLLSIGADLLYFIGYEAMPSERLTVLVVRSQGTPTLIIPQLEAPRVDAGDFETRPWGETEDPIGSAVRSAGNPKVVAVGDHMWSAFLVRFQRQWTHAGWIPASVLTSKLRVHKDEHEIDALRSAAHGVDRVMERIQAEVRFGGRTELDVARRLREMTVEEGHDLAEFAIVGSGPNGASPHHGAGDRVIQRGDLIVCDFGGRWNGYYSDSTRTFSVGEPTAKQREAHQVVLAANEAGRAAVAPEVPCQEIDRAARVIIDQAGMGDLFIHRTGHGIGLEVHESPYLVEGNEANLEAGMAFSVEPGVYIPGEFGVRIEDIVVCSADGAEVLNQSSRDLLGVE